MPEINPSEIVQYAEAHSSPQSALLNEITQFTHTHTQHANMLSGHLQGRLLALLSTLKEPQHILDIGTFTGFSALCLAEGLSPNGKLTTIDIDNSLKSYVDNFFARSTHAKQIHYHIGDAKQLIPALNHTYDIAFIDAHKPEYIDYYENSMRRLAQGGLIIADNVLWSGEVLASDTTPDDSSARALHAFNERLAADHRIQQLLLPLRDGLTIARKL